MGQAPNPIDILVCPVELTKMKVDRQLRTKLFINIGRNNFEIILEKLLFKLMPKAYLEGYKENRQITLNAYPKNVKNIFTANAYVNDEAFKIWAAENVEKGSKLLIGQHGGRVGTALLSQALDHQVSISDRYYSWGWKGNSNHRNIVPLPASRLIYKDKKCSPDPKGHILCVLPNTPRYYYYHSSMPLASQFISHINDQLTLAKRVSDPVLKLLRFRLGIRSDGYDLKARFKDNGLESLIDIDQKEFINRANETRLCILSDNSTSLLEMMYANFPNLIFWNPKYYELSNEAKPYFDAFHDLGIMHYTAESAASQIDKIYKDTIIWWQEPEIQKARERFCNQFSYVGQDWLKEYKAELQSPMD